MTDTSEDEYLVRVRAQVMYREENAGGWITLDGGGLSHVMVGRRRVTVQETTAESSPKLQEQEQSQIPYEYFIQGIRISDGEEILTCTIKKDFQFNKVMPTFHHWLTDERRYGLTFQTAADARAFDRGVRSAVEQLLDGLGGSWSNISADKRIGDQETDEERIFECLNLPSDLVHSSEAKKSNMEEKDSTFKQTNGSPPSTQSSLKQFNVITEQVKPSDETSFIDVSTVPSDEFPVITSEKTSPITRLTVERRDSGSIRKEEVRSFTGVPPSPQKNVRIKIRCRHCHELYSENANVSGACRSAPDRIRSCIERVSCMNCARAMLYHCTADAEGEYDSLSCSPISSHCCKRWFSLSLLSLVVPCLCCYVPLRAVHNVARNCHWAGGLHAPLD